MDIADSAAEYPVLEERSIAKNPLFEHVEARIDLHGTHVTRAYVKHPSAVAVVATNDAGEVLLLRQYRHPVRSLLWEIPAGILDVEAESMRAAAARELAEEADLSARRWHTLVDFHSTPGMSDESLRIYLAEGLSEVPAQHRHHRQGEEAGIITRWVSLSQAVQLILAGKIRNPTAVTGLLALHAARSTDTALRPAEASWDHHPRGVAP
ncbi:NUDIX domain-containing protein [Nesterenkonia alba]|uniref:NUDIX domain-containing protein n=1 Tax=Nesterenkonia alba TaxID=515814 RepID=UPI0003B57D35|nr:NUDIX hydrolase [Nesterenkonia alba]